MTRGEGSEFGGSSLDRSWLWLALILFAGAVIRGIDLGHHALWGDEALSLVFARYPVGDLFLRPIDPSPGLYYSIQKLWLPMGEEAWVVRLPSFLFGIATIAAAYWLGRACDGAATGLLAAAFVAVMPDLVDYAQEARAYALLILLETLALAALATAFGRSERRISWLLAAGGFAVLAVYTHVTAWFVVVPAGLVALYFGWRQRIMTPVQASIVLLTGLVLVIPELARAAGLSGNPQFAWLEQLDLARFLTVSGTMVAPIPSYQWTDLVGRTSYWTAEKWWIAGTSSLAIALAWAVLAGRKIRGRAPLAFGSPVARLILLILLLVAPLTMYLFGLVTPIVVPRTLLPLTIGVALGLAMACRRAAAPGLTVAALAFVGAELLLFGTVRDKTDWRAISRAAIAIEARDGVFVCSDWRTPAFAAAHRETSRRSIHLYTVLAGHPVQILSTNDPVGAAPDLFIERLWRANTDAGFRIAESAQVDPSRIEDIAIVDMDCPARSRAVLDRWFDPSGRSEMRRIGSRPGGPVATVERWQR